MIIGQVPCLTKKPEEVASMLGISRNTIYTLIHSGELRSIKIGRKFLIPVIAIDELLRGK
jgi:excisionase family DNA binding protein